MISVFIEESGKHKIKLISFYRNKMIKKIMCNFVGSKVLAQAMIYFIDFLSKASMMGFNLFSSKFMFLIFSILN